MSEEQATRSKVRSKMQAYSLAVSRVETLSRVISDIEEKGFSYLTPYTAPDYEPDALVSVPKDIALPLYKKALEDAQREVVAFEHALEPFLALKA